MSEKIIILGTGGNCIDLLECILDINEFCGETKYTPIGFLDDNPSTWERKFFDIPVLGPLSESKKYPHCKFVNGIGSEKNFWKKKEILSSLNIPLEQYETIIHPSANVSRLAHLGHGVVLFQNVSVTSNAIVGNHVIILPNTVISHDDIVGDYCCFAAGVCVSGNVTIDHSCYLGSNSAIINGIHIGNSCLVGMGSVVLQDIVPNSVVVGNPAHFLRHTYIDDKL